MQPDAIKEALVFQNTQKAKIEQRGQWAAGQANKADFELCNNLMLLDTVALTATILVLASDKTVQALNKGAAILLVITSICVILSIFCGIGNYIMLNRFQNRWAGINSKIAGRLSGGLLNLAQMNQILAEEQSNVPIKSNPIFWYGQILFLSIALVLYLAIIIDVLSKKL